MKIKNIISSLLAGMVIGFAGLCYVLCRSYILDSGLFIGALVFPIGLYLICTLSLNLFTGKVGNVFQNKQLTISYLLVMLLCNLVGAVLIGFVSYLLFNNNTQVISVIDAISKVKEVDFEAFFRSIGLIFIKAILCGMMVYLAVYLYNLGKDALSKFLGVLIPIFIFVFCGFDHCIANMFYFGFSLNLSLSSFVSMLIVIVGNILGAWVLYFAFKALNKGDNND